MPFEFLRYLVCVLLNVHQLVLPIFDRLSDASSVEIESILIDIHETGLSQFQIVASTVELNVNGVTMYLLPFGRESAEIPNMSAMSQPADARTCLLLRYF